MEIQTWNMQNQNIRYVIIIINILYNNLYIKMEILNFINW